MCGKEKQCPLAEFRRFSPLNKMHFLQTSILDSTLCYTLRGVGRQGEDSLGLITGFSLTRSPVAAAAEGQEAEARLLPADVGTDPHVE